MEDWIAVSRHAYDRWRQRADEPGIGPRVAWERGEPYDGTGVDGDEARYHAETETLLVVDDGVLVTVIDVRRAADAAVRNLAGGASA